MEMLPLWLLSPLLLSVAYFDLRYMRIPNVLSVVAVGLFILTVPLLGWTEFAVRLAVSTIVFGLGFAAFSLRFVGGGDVKILACLMLFIPSQTYQTFGFGFSAALILGILFVLGLRVIPRLQSTHWVTIQSRGTFPMGISIALSGLLHPFLVHTLQ